MMMVIVFDPWQATWVLWQPMADSLLWQRFLVGEMTGATRTCHYQSLYVAVCLYHVTMERRHGNQRLCGNQIRHASHQRTNPEPACVSKINLQLQLLFIFISNDHRARKLKPFTDKRCPSKQKQISNYVNGRHINLGFSLSSVQGKWIIVHP